MNLGSGVDPATVTSADQDKTAIEKIVCYFQFPRRWGMPGLMRPQERTDREIEQETSRKPLLGFLREGMGKTGLGS